MPVHDRQCAPLRWACTLARAAHSTMSILRISCDLTCMRARGRRRVCVSRVPVRVPMRVPVPPRAPRSTLVDNFAVFNYWHASVPGPTLVNRAFIDSCTSHGYGTNSALEVGLGYPQRTIFQVWRSSCTLLLRMRVCVRGSEWFGLSVHCLV